METIEVGYCYEHNHNLSLGSFYCSFLLPSVSVCGLILMVILIQIIECLIGSLENKNNVMNTTWK